MKLLLIVVLFPSLNTCGNNEHISKTHGNTVAELEEP